MDFKVIRRACCLFGVLVIPAIAAEPVVPRSKPIDLLDENLSRLYSFLQDSSYEDPLDVFSYADGMLRITGQSWGGITTKDEYANYHMVFEFKWGERTWGGRKDRARDSGILVHCTGPDGGYGGVSTLSRA